MTSDDVFLFVGDDVFLCILVDHGIVSRQTLTRATGADRLYCITLSRPLPTHVTSVTHACHVRYRNWAALCDILLLTKVIILPPLMV